MRYEMPEDLLEISGIAFRNSNSDTVFAVQDEERRVFHFHCGNNNPMENPLAKKVILKMWPFLAIG